MTNAAPKQPPAIWPPFKLVIFDCDSTLTLVEGIDELARIAAEEDTSGGRSAESIALSIATLTKRAMEGDLPLEAVYGQRLHTVNPTLAQVSKIASIYREKVIPDARQVIEALQALGCKVFIVSGGLFQAVRDFGVWLGVPVENIFAVDMEYDQLSGAWWRYWEQPGGQNPRANHLAVEASPLTGTRGKNRIIAHIRASHPGRAMLVGDGLSDLEAGGEVNLFVGFGGAVYRQRIDEGSPVYIRSASLASVLPLGLGLSGNTPPYTALWVEGLRQIIHGETVFHDRRLFDTFRDAIRGPLAKEAL